MSAASLNEQWKKAIWVQLRRRGIPSRTVEIGYSPQTARYSAIVTLANGQRGIGFITPATPEQMEYGSSIVSVDDELIARLLMLL